MARDSRTCGNGEAARINERRPATLLKENKKNRAAGDPLTFAAETAR
jgi:hypothetical protein